MDEFEGARCLGCGKPYSGFGMDVVLPRSQWCAIHPDEDGLLCAQCIVDRVHERIAGATVIHAIVEVSPHATIAVPPPPAAEKTAREVLVALRLCLVEAQKRVDALEQSKGVSPELWNSTITV